ncbi:MAG TPA: ROK family protein [Candidatus Omnitrophota bacterium]|nr:ROK family protein [Candidatus Omnitrophota bacterium]HPS20565.1 ROK family protein [Candidatus Omnitrophota bacterium]
MKKYIVGVDIGGTKIAAGAITPKGKLVGSVTVPTMADKGKTASIGQVVKAIETLFKENGLGKNNVEGIGLCAPGPLSPQKGVVYNPPNLPGWKNVKLSSFIEKKFGIKAKLDNDANAAGVAEMIWGAAKGYKDIFYVTVSTGIGTGVIIDGKLYYGKNGMAGEGGHMTIKFDSEVKCGCGAAGCIEALASGPHTVKWLQEEMKKDRTLKTMIPVLAGGDINAITMVTIAEAAKNGDSLALRTIKRQGDLIGIWLGNIINILDPEIIVIGGGVSMIGELIFKEIRSSTAANSINIFAGKTPIVRAKLRHNVGVFGAASLFVA